MKRNDGEYGLPHIGAAIGRIQREPPGIGFHFDVTAGLQKIKAAFDIRDFTDIGQRTQLSIVGNGFRPVCDDAGLAFDKQIAVRFGNLEMMDPVAVKNPCNASCAPQAAPSAGKIRRSAREWKVVRGAHH